MSGDIRDKIKSVLCRKYKHGKNFAGQYQPQKKQGESSSSNSDQQPEEGQCDRQQQNEHPQPQNCPQPSDQDGQQQNKQDQGGKQQQQEQQQQQENEQLEQQLLQQQQQTQQQEQEKNIPLSNEQEQHESCEAEKNIFCQECKDQQHNAPYESHHQYPKHQFLHRVVEKQRQEEAEISFLYPGQLHNPPAESQHHHQQHQFHHHVAVKQHQEQQQQRHHHQQQQQCDQKQLDIIHQERSYQSPSNGHQIYDKDEDNVNVDISERASSQNVPTSAGTTTVSSVPPLMTSEHQSTSSTETSITATLITSPTSSSVVSSPFGLLSATLSGVGSNDTICSLPEAGKDLHLQSEGRSQEAETANYTFQQMIQNGSVRDLPEKVENQTSEIEDTKKLISATKSYLHQGENSTNEKCNQKSRDTHPEMSEIESSGGSEKNLPQNTQKPCAIKSFMDNLTSHQKAKQKECVHNIDQNKDFLSQNHKNKSVLLLNTPNLETSNEDKDSKKQSKNIKLNIELDAKEETADNYNKNIIESRGNIIKVTTFDCALKNKRGASVSCIGVEKSRGEAILLDSDDDLVSDKDDDETDNENDIVEKEMFHKGNTAVPVFEEAKNAFPTVGSDGLMDVYELKQVLDAETKKLNLECDEHRRNEKYIRRLNSQIHQVKKEIVYLEELNEKCRTVMKTLQGVVNTERNVLASACDSKSVTTKLDAQVQRLEGNCLRDYYNIKDDKDAKRLLDTIREKMKALARLELQVQKKRLILKHALPVTLKEAPPMKIPIAKKIKRPLDFTKNGGGSCGKGSKAGIRPVVVEILSCLAGSGSTSWVTPSGPSSSLSIPSQSHLRPRAVTAGGTPTSSTLSTESDDVSLFSRVMRHHQGTSVD